MFAATLESVAADLRAAGIPATIDPRNLNPPAVLVRGDQVDAGAGKLCGTETIRFSLLLVVPDIGEASAYAALDALYSTVKSAGAAVRLTTDPRPFERTVLPDSPTALPTLRLTGTRHYDPAYVTPATDPATTGGHRP